MHRNSADAHCIQKQDLSDKLTIAQRNHSLSKLDLFLVASYHAIVRVKQNLNGFGTVSSECISCICPPKSVLLTCVIKVAQRYMENGGLSR